MLLLARLQRNRQRAGRLSSLGFAVQPSRTVCLSVPAIPENGDLWKVKTGPF